MLKKQKLFYVVPETLGIKEVKGFKPKFLALLFGSLFIALLVVLGTNHFLNDVLGLGYNRIETLTNENKILKEQVEQMTKKLDRLEGTIDRLAERDNELRLVADLPKIDEDIRKVGTGGTEQSYDFGLSSGEANDLLRSSSILMDKLERQINLQDESYNEIYKKLEFNKTFFTHLPAIKPMEGFYSRNSFGYRLHPVLQVLKFHEGLDIINDVGTPVHATGDGTVSFVGLNAGYGLTVEIDHGYGYQTLYAHLSKSLAKKGQQVKRGDIIARSGHSGLVSGPHLHYEVRVNGQKQNPINYFFDDSTPPNSIAQLSDR
jgi:murein DD-endopeptidase MepM/ murein hydrolase activator NlpD